MSRSCQVQSTLLLRNNSQQLYSRGRARRTSCSALPLCGVFLTLMTLYVTLVCYIHFDFNACIYGYIYVCNVDLYMYLHNEVYIIYG